ncbi:MAG: hypothetical protein JRI25_27190 [Deltaproteobacteria bacterium]|nr:hypothetical protein [Deltaproteobacteria bacterium]
MQYVDPLHHPRQRAGEEKKPWCPFYRGEGEAFDYILSRDCQVSREDDAPSEKSMLMSIYRRVLPNDRGEFCDEFFSAYSDALVLEQERGAWGLWRVTGPLPAKPALHAERECLPEDLTVRAPQERPFPVN